VAACLDVIERRLSTIERALGISDAAQPHGVLTAASIQTLAGHGVHLAARKYTALVYFRGVW